MRQGSYEGSFVTPTRRSAWEPGPDGLAVEVPFITQPARPISIDEPYIYWSTDGIWVSRERPVIKTINDLQDSFFRVSGEINAISAYCCTPLLNLLKAILYFNWAKFLHWFGKMR